MTTINKKTKILFFALILVVSSLSFSGCATFNNNKLSASGLSSNNIKLNTRMAASIFLQPVSKDDRVVYVSVRNTSTAKINFKKALVSKLVSDGYVVTEYPKLAHFILMVNVLYVGKQNETDKTSGAILGGTIGALIGSRYNSRNAELDAGSVGSLLGGVVGSLIDKVKYLMMTDIQLEERRPNTITTTSTYAQQGTSSNMYQYSDTIKNWAIYRDILVSEASGYSLTFASAEPMLSEEMAHALGNLLP